MGDHVNSKLFFKVTWGLDFCYNLDLKCPLKTSVRSSPDISLADLW